MTDRHPYIKAIIIIACLMAAVLLWQQIAVPGFTEKERRIRNENVAFIKYISEIEAMNGSTGYL
jgi:protein-tyrosine phosphatase